jgi:hypothetical protein
MGDPKLEIRRTVPLGRDFVKWFNSQKGFDFISPEGGVMTFSSTSPPWSAQA